MCIILTNNINWVRNKGRHSMLLFKGWKTSELNWETFESKFVLFFWHGNH